MSLDHSVQLCIQPHLVTAWKFARSWPPSASPNSCSITASKFISRNSTHHGLQLNLHTCCIMASTLAWLWPSSASPNSLHHRLPVQPWVHSNIASTCIFVFAPSQHPSSLSYGLQVHLQSCLITFPEGISKLAQTRSHSAFLHSLDHCLQVYLQIHPIIASKWISHLARSQPLSVSLCSLHRHCQAHLKLLPSTICSESRYTVCRWVAIQIHRWEYKLNTWVLKIIEGSVVAMICRHTPAAFPRKILFSTDCSTVIQRGPRHVNSTPRLVISASRTVIGAAKLVAGFPRYPQGHLKSFQVLWGVPKLITITSL